jgi:hypothetical protein
MDLKAIRKSFVEKVSWGPGKITYGEAIAAFDHVMAEYGLSGTDAPSSYSPVPDGLSIPVTPRFVKRGKVEDSMALDSDQENAAAIKALGVS